MVKTKGEYRNGNVLLANAGVVHTTLSVLKTCTQEQGNAGAIVSADTSFVCLSHVVLA